MAVFPEDAGTKTLLIVDDAVPNRLLLKKAVSADYQTLEAGNGQEALDILRSAPDISLVILDIMMPVLDGYGVLEQMGADEALSKIPVVVVTASEDMRSQIKAFDLGAVDVIIKPFNPQIILHRVHNIISRRESERISEQNREYERALREADFDKLTGIYSREGFYRHVRECLAADPGGDYVLIRFDIDRFKAYNDTFGLEAGDKLLCDIGDLLRGFAAEEMVFGRIESDHFAVVLTAENYDAHRIDSVFREWLAEYPTEFRLSSSAGIYRISDPGIDVSLMCDRALMALRTVKNSYSDKVAYYSEDMRREILEEQELTGEMDAALEGGQFLVYFQPQVNYENGQLIGAEALVRWNHPVRGLIPPGRFIPLFEKNGFISKLDEFVWDKSCAYMRKWLDNRGMLLPVSVSVNISRMDIYNKNLCSNLMALVNKYDLTPSSLRLEITEGVYMEDSELLAKVVSQLQAAGFTVEMDDFGSGYSSLNMLKDVPVDILKLDMRFLSSSRDEARGGNILSSVIRMANWLRLPIITEGVETREQADYLKNLGACYMQGYYFGKPMPAEEFEAILSGKNVGALDRYRSADIDGMAAFWDASAQNALLFNSYVGGAIIAEYQGGRLEATRLNDNFFDIIGVSRGDYLKYQFDLLERIDPEYLNQAEQEAAKAVREGREFGYDLKFKPLRQGEAPKWLHIRGRLLARATDRLLLYLSVENITERITLERKLAAASQESQALIDNIPGGIIRFRVSGGIASPEYVSDGFCRLLGYTPQEMRDAHIKEYSSFAHPDDQRRLAEAERATIERGVPFDEQYRIRRRDGRYIWIMLHAVKMPASDGGDIIYGIFTDLTGIKDMEEKLENDKQELESVIRSIPGGAATFEVGGGSYKLVYCSDGVPSLFEMDRAEYLSVTHDGRHVGILDADVESVTSAVDQAAAGMKELDVTFRLLRSGGNVVWINLRGGVIGERDGHPLLHMIFHNMSSAAELYQDIVDESGTAILVADLHTRELLYINEAAARFAGKSKEDYAGRKCFEYMMSGGAPCSFCGLHQNQGDSCQKIVMGGRHYNTTFKRVRWNGHDAYIQYLSDITDEWNMERVIAQEKDKLQNIVDSVTAGIAVYTMGSDGSLSLTVANRAFDDILGIDHGGFGHSLYTSIMSRVFKEDAAEIEKYAGRLLSGGGDARAAFRLRDSEGDGFKWIYLSAVCSRTPGGEVTIFSTFTDVTEIKRLEEKVEREKSIVNLAMRNSDVCFWKYYPVDGSADLLGREKCLLFPEKRMSNVPQSIVESGVIHPDSREDFIKLHDEIDSGAAEAGAFIRLNRDKTGVDWVRIDYSTDTEDPTAVIGVCKEATDEMRREQADGSARISPLGRMLSGGRSQIESEFLSRMSHEIRTPMNAIIGLTDLTKGLCPDRPDIIKNLDSISSAGSFLLTLFNDALDMSAIERGELDLRPEIYTSAQFDNFVETMLRPICRRYGLEFKADANAYRGDLFVDKERFNQILLNLVSNAAKFTPRGGLVELVSSAAEEPGSPGIIDYRITVRDNGIGMSPEFQKHVFDKCARNPEELPMTYRSSGVGLPVCKSIADRMGGSISIDSAVGRGTSVTVHLPLMTSISPAPDPEIPPQLKNRRVLLAEDDDISSLIAKSLLEKAGMSVVCVKNGREALDAFSDSQDGYFDVLLLDVRMPVMDGLECARAIRALPRSDAASVPIAAESANAYATDVEASLSAGMNAHLAKPLEPVRLFETLAKLIAERK